MNEETIAELCVNCFVKKPRNIVWCAVGQGNYVYIAEFPDEKTVVRCSREAGAYRDTIYWMGAGDNLTYVAMTNMALLYMRYDTDYVTYLLEEMQLSEEERKAFAFYTLLFCVDFMGERGMRFMDQQVPVSAEIVEKMNAIYEKLWKEYVDLCGD